MKERSLTDVHPSLLSWIQRHARFSPSWDEPLLRGFLEGRGVPCAEILVDWERELHALGEGSRTASSYLIELSGARFGTMAVGASPATLPGDGGSVVVIGRFVWGGALGMDERGRLYRSDGDGWIALADHPAVYLARLALTGVAEEEQRLHLVLSGREGASLLAERLGAAESAAASDDLQRFWQSDTLLVNEGDIDEPAAPVVHAFAGPPDVTRLIAACSALGLSGALVSLPQASTIAPLARQPGGCPHAVWFRHRPRFGRGGGWVAWIDGSDPPVIEEVCTVDGYRVSRAEWPSGRTVEHVAPWVEGMPERGEARLLRLGFRRDLRRTCPGAELDALLARHGLPSTPAVHALERRLGGLRCPLREGAASLSFGAFQMLAFEREAADHASWAKDSATLEEGAAWPRVRFQGAPLVPVGSDVEATLYMGPEGALLRHDWILDEVDDLGEDPIEYLERRLVALESS
ncbi:hypothetical protein WME76_12635 [Sorangium sp. So ce119]|uniref:hypothetical protein n=1 Tax=Sorangium sp. So ce119 TaxID=3133279 RepID=UPI003F628E18